MLRSKGILVKVLATLIAIISFASTAQAVEPQFSPFWWFKPSKPATETATIKPQPAILTFLPRISNRIIEEATVVAKDRTIVAGWLTPWGDDSYQSFINNLNTITEVHPFVYTIDADGVSLVPEANEWHKDKVKRQAKEHGILILPTISGDVNYSDLMLNDPAKRTAHIDKLLAEVKKEGYDGIDIDYEGFLNGYNRDVYASFMKELADKFHAEDKLVGVAIEAFNTKQNWDEIGKVVDRFEIMGYDYHSASGPEVGAIGPAGWLKEVVAYAATRVPKEKIVLGLGTYGYSWIASGSHYTSVAVSHAHSLAIAQEMGAAIKRGEDNAPYFTYDRGQGQRYLYFEDVLSTQPKLTMVKESGIGGIAFWRLGTEDGKIWTDVDQILH
jgi:spore germination protein